jgi:hypothetical protein
MSKRGGPGPGGGGPPVGLTGGPNRNGKSGATVKFNFDDYSEINLLPEDGLLGDNENLNQIPDFRRNDPRDHNGLSNVNNPNDLTNINVLDSSAVGSANGSATGDHDHPDHGSSADGGNLSNIINVSASDNLRINHENLNTNLQNNPSAMPHLNSLLHSASSCSSSASCGDNVNNPNANQNPPSRPSFLSEAMHNTPSGGGGGGGNTGNSGNPNSGNPNAGSSGPGGNDGNSGGESNGGNNSGGDSNQHGTSSQASHQNPAMDHTWPDYSTDDDLASTMRGGSEQEIQEMKAKNRQAVVRSYSHIINVQEHI